MILATVWMIAVVTIYAAIGRCLIWWRIMIAILAILIESMSGCRWSMMTTRWWHCVWRWVLWMIVSRWRCIIKTVRWSWRHWFLTESTVITLLYYMWHNTNPIIPARIRIHLSSTLDWWPIIFWFWRRHRFKCTARWWWRCTDVWTFRWFCIISLRCWICPTKYAHANTTWINV